MTPIKIFLSAYFLLGFWIVTLSQNTRMNTGPMHRSDCNQSDSHGKKYGLWIENKGNTYCYYKDNERNGTLISYSRKTGKVNCIGEYSNGKPAGKWYYFDESDHLLFTQENIQSNKSVKRKRDDGAAIIPEFISFVKNYFQNGVMKSEGQVLYDDDIEIDYYETGSWKYYDESGKLVKTETFDFK